MLPARVPSWLIWSPYFLGASRATANLRLSTRSRATFTVSGVAASAISMISGKYLSACDSRAIERLEIDAACACAIVAYMVAVFFGGEPRDSEFAAIDAQPRNVHGFRRCGICDLNDLRKVFVRLRLARDRASGN